MEQAEARFLHKLEGMAQATRREWGQPFDSLYKAHLEAVSAQLQAERTARQEAEARELVLREALEQIAHPRIVQHEDGMQLLSPRPSEIANAAISNPSPKVKQLMDLLAAIEAEEDFHKKNPMPDDFYSSGYGDYMQAYSKMRHRREQALKAFRA